MRHGATLRLTRAPRARRRAAGRSCTRSCRRSTSARPSSVLHRPPASSTIGTSAATSQSDTIGSIAMSNAPSATSMCCQKSPTPRVRQQRCDEREQLVADAVGVEALRGVPRERDLRVVERRDRRHADALAVAERAEPARRPTSACPSAGADTTPTHELARVLEADQRRPDRHAAHVALRAVDRVDDPAELGVVDRRGRRTPRRRTAWSVTSASRSRIARSTAWSASLTGVRSGFVVDLQVVRRGTAPS